MTFIGIRYHQIYQEYVGLIDQRLQGFLDVQSVTAEQVYEDLMHIEDENRQSIISFDYLIAAFEYEEFLHLMADFCGISLHEAQAQDQDRAKGDAAEAIEEA